MQPLNMSQVSQDLKTQESTQSQTLVTIPGAPMPARPIIPRTVVARQGGSSVCYNAGRSLRPPLEHSSSKGTTWHTQMIHNPLAASSVHLLQTLRLGHAIHGVGFSCAAGASRERKLTLLGHGPVNDHDEPRSFIWPVLKGFPTSTYHEMHLTEPNRVLEDEANPLHLDVSLVFDPGRADGPQLANRSSTLQKFCWCLLDWGLFLKDNITHALSFILLSFLASVFRHVHADLSLLCAAIVRGQVRNYVNSEAISQISTPIVSNRR
ncbi:hypothetical protein QBC42DRAFT_42515 [Cladorrhinum samala]|uniref:Uncharacterized protein n=1 Tax=Cladorrhinum samala TaxID=585594 RepID=A0AAV9I1L2_9PEZI|nr:hypothetical protein QBC42DRAFT_42515 [Cladorrhinum samala]